MSDVSVTMLSSGAALTGTLTGTGLPAAGTKVTTVVNAVTTTAQVPAAKLAAAMATPEPSPTATGEPLCRVLTLDVTDLHLDLLGLVVLVPKPGLHLIVGGAPRPGALLGNLLCGIAGGPDPVLTIPPPDVAPAAQPPVAPATATAPAAPATTAAVPALTIG